MTRTTSSESTRTSGLPEGSQVAGTRAQVRVPAADPRRMSIDAAISRIDQILGMERQLLGPAAAAANPAALNGAGGTSPASGTGAGSFANSLASAQASSGGASPQDR